MPLDVKVWDTIQFDDVENYGDLYQNLCVFKYGSYLRDFKDIIRDKRILREAEGQLVVIELNKRRVSFSLKFQDGSITKPVLSKKLPLIFSSRKSKNNLVMFFAEAETNARMNHPKNANDFVPLEMPEIFFTS